MNKTFLLYHVCILVLSISPATVNAAPLSGSGGHTQASCYATSDSVSNDGAEQIYVYAGDTFQGVVMPGETLSLRASSPVVYGVNDSGDTICAYYKR